MEEIRRSHDNVLLLDAGDQFQGTIWFLYYQGDVTAHFMKRLGYDAMVRTTHAFIQLYEVWYHAQVLQCCPGLHMGISTLCTKYFDKIDKNDCELRTNI